MSKKVLTGALAALMATGAVAPVFANTNVSDLHGAAFEATQKALTEKTQLSINEAREAIEAFKAAIGDHSDISTWSTMIDAVQHPIYVEIVDGLLALGSEDAVVSQEAVNKIYTLIYNGEGTADDVSDEYKNGANYGWSEQTDNFQNVIIKRVVAAVEAAEAEKTQEAVDAAKVAVAELATSVNESAATYAAKAEAQVEAVQAEIDAAKEESKGEIKVTEATITKSGVTVEFEALEVEIENATIEVVDNNGKTVAVKAKTLLDQGETTATFQFSTALTERAEGVWTINGFEVNCDAVNLVSDVKAATTATKLYMILENSSLVENLVDEVANQNEYLELVQAAGDELTLVSDIQTIIDLANKNVDSEALVQSVIKVANEGTFNKFKSEFAKLDLERVNENWLEDYRSEVAAVSTNKLSDVQDAIDKINNKKVEAAEADLTTDGKLDSEKINTAIELVETYVVAKEDDSVAVKAKADRIQALKVKLAVVGVNDSTSKVSLQNALVSLEKVVNDKNVFTVEKNVNSNLLATYAAERKNAEGENVEFFESVEKILEFFTATQEKTITTAGETVLTKAGEVNSLDADKKATKKVEFIASLTKLAEVSAKSATEFDGTIVNESLYDLYASSIETAAANTVETITAAIKSVNENIVNEIMKDANEETLLAKLQDSRIGLTNVVTANKSAYVEELVELQAVTTVKELSTLVDRINAKEVIVSAENAAEVKAALVTYIVKTNTEELKNLKDVQKTDLAEEVFTAINAKDADVVETLEKLDEVIEAANTTRAGKITSINEKLVQVEGTISDAVAQLVGVSAEFKALDEETQLVVAEKFINALPVDKDGEKVEFTNYTEIRAILATCM